MEMRLSEIKEAIRFLLKSPSQRPAIILGPPGCGKSHGAYQAAEEAGYPVRAVLRMGFRDLSDLNGVPVPCGDYTLWLKPEIVKTCENEKRPSTLLVDDVTQAAPAVQNTIAPLLYPEPDGTRRIGDHLFPKNWKVIITGNRKQDKSNAHELAKFAADRVVEMHHKPHYEDFMEHISKKAMFHPLVVACHRNWGQVGTFQKETVELHYNFNPANPDDRGASWRGWEAVSKYEYEREKDPIPSKVFNGIVVGIIGHTSGMIYSQFCQLVDKLPNIDRILAGHKNVKVPEEMNIQFALVTILGRRIDETNAKNVLAYAEALPAEFQHLLVGDAEALNKDIVQVRAVQEWISKHRSVRA